ncbi:MAG: hypothetical protein AAF639_15525, partial [Chloroflexota bacterium]
MRITQSKRLVTSIILNHYRTIITLICMTIIMDSGTVSIVYAQNAPTEHIYLPMIFQPNSGTNWQVEYNASSGLLPNENEG